MEEQKQPQTLSAKSPFFATRDGILLTQSTNLNTQLFVQNKCPHPLPASQGTQIGKTSIQKKKCLKNHYFFLLENHPIILNQVAQSTPKNHKNGPPITRSWADFHPIKSNTNNDKISIKSLAKIFFKKKTGKKTDNWRGRGGRWRYYRHEFEGFRVWNRSKICCANFAANVKREIREEGDACFFKFIYLGWVGLGFNGSSIDGVRLYLFIYFCSFSIFPRNIPNLK